VTAVVVVVASLVTVWRWDGPPPRAAEAPLGEFSSARAYATLARVLGESRPHPRGSVANREVRRRIELELQTLGLEPRVDRTSAWRGGRGAEVENVVVTIRGRYPTNDALVLVAHYDSVPTAPGASDDGAGVATLLEVARALVASPPLEHDVVVLFDDGEEAGLLGAQAFVVNAEESSRAGAVVNVEARGTHGPSLLFETKHLGWTGVRAIGALERPATSSLFSAVYERMPNDTDLTVFGEAGIPGYNFAFIRGASHYHRPSDDLEHLSRASLQHHGDNVLALTRELAGRPEPLAALRAGPRAVWFDLFACVTIAWPEPASFLFAFASTALLAAARRRRARGVDGWLVAAGAGWLLALALPSAAHLALAPAFVASLGAALSTVPHRLAAGVGAGLRLLACGLAAALLSEVGLGLRDAFLG